MKGMRIPERSVMRRHLTEKRFSVEVCQRWEEAFFAVDHPETRQVVLRIGFVLGRDGGALEPLQKLARFGLGGKIGSGNSILVGFIWRI